MIKVSVENREDVLYLVRNLEDFEKDKAVKSGLRSAVNLLRARGRGNLRARLMRHGKQTGHLMNSFTNRVKRNKLGALAGFDRPGGNHAHLVDRGTKRRYTRSGKHLGVMPGNRFWTDTEESEEKNVMKAVLRGMGHRTKRIK